MPSLFLDTNVFLHYQQFDQIDWVILMNSGDVEIIIPPVTLRELNKNKELHKHSHIRERAKKSLDLLDNFFEPNKNVKVKDNLTIRFEDREPNINFELNQLDPTIQDDQLIASILMCRNERPEKTIILVTSDIGLLLRTKAGRQNIQTYKIPEKFKLQEHPDPAQKKIQELTNELKSYKNRVPKLLLLFENGNKFIEFNLPAPIEKDSLDFRKKIDEIKRQFPKSKTSEDVRKFKEGEKEGEMSQQLLKYLAYDGISESEYERYNKELEKFYNRYSIYLNEELKYANLKRRTIILNIMISNTGTIPANDIDVIMRFPDGFRIVEEEGFPESPNKPKPPDKPRSFIEMMAAPSQSLSFLHEIPGLNDINPIETPANVSSFEIKRTNSYLVKLHINNVKHNMNEYFEPLYLMFNSFEDANSFKIEYELFAANIPSPISEFLCVVIEKENDKETDN